jgi:hypothetical protein
VTGRPINALELYSRFKDQWDTTSQPLKERATVLPFGQYEDGSVGLAWPGLLAAPVEGVANFGKYANAPTGAAVPLAGETQDTDPALLEYLRLTGQIPY